MGKLSKRLGRIIQDFDLFGVPVQLTYKGERRFNSCCGGSVSILMIVCLVGAFIWQIQNLILQP